MSAVAVIGSGRVGLTLARALVLSGARVTVCGRVGRTLPSPLGSVTTAWAEPIADASVVMICAPDDAIAMVAARVAALGVVRADHVVLHCSGRLGGHEALALLAPTGAALGSWHPLQSLRDPAGTPEALVGAPAVLEGDSGAVAVARELAERCQMRPIVEVAAAAKPAYHAAAVFAGNYLVVLAAVAERLVQSAGVDADAGLFLPLMQRSLANLAASDPAHALTGPVRRGDAGTVRAHLDALDAPTRELYRRLALEAVRLAERDGAEMSAMRTVLDA